jgi:hypothetical protein
MAGKVSTGQWRADIPASLPVTGNHPGPAQAAPCAHNMNSRLTFQIPFHHPAKIRPTKIIPRISFATIRMIAILPSLFIDRHSVEKLVDILRALPDNPGAE